ncbi:unnamed protein product [Thlaspi arvense]|uniref:Uncharacterized protein n=1 Tax=Thlaspi arvense TaxID=13288 RepID=A0AAU9S9T5_THLAR|nr:unnamed protein product [Thlaspi arvense]
MESILHGDLLKQSLWFEVGDESVISTWTDPLLPTNPPHSPTPKNEIFHYCLLKDWITPHQRWKVDKICSFLEEKDANTILSLRLCSQPTPDLLGWHYNKSGAYIVNGYRHIIRQDQDTSPQQEISVLKMYFRRKELLLKFNIFFGS